ncbi:MAG TPA: thioredoxin domain-containing protein [Nitrososphaerales archaeon]|nr:thioredoxin domain-containing protein [Nitrososphaerales archaeon]
MIAESITQEELYAKFEDSVRQQRDGKWVLAVFEGSPTGEAYSWCSDCVAASEDLRSFMSEYRGFVKLIIFKVGSKKEWKGASNGPSPFKVKFPHLVDLPTAILFHGKLDVARTIAPRKGDLLYLSGRAEALEAQVKDGSWNPPGL